MQVAMLLSWRVGELEGGDEHRKRPENVLPYISIYSFMRILFNGN
jgi:hypothetical protein